MATVDSKLTDFCSYVQTLTNCEVWKGRRSLVPQMNKTFITVGILSCQAVMNDKVDLLHQHEDNDLLVEKVRGLAEFSFVIQCFGKGSNQILKRLKDAFFTSIWERWSTANQFGFKGNSDIEDISATVLDSNYEERSQLKVDFYIPIAEEFNIDFFNKIKVTVEAKDLTLERKIPQVQESEE